VNKSVTKIVKITTLSDVDIYPENFIEFHKHFHDVTNDDVIHEQHRLLEKIVQKVKLIKS